MLAVLGAERESLRKEKGEWISRDPPLHRQVFVDSCFSRAPTLQLGSKADRAARDYGGSPRAVEVKTNPDFQFKALRSC